MVVPRDRTSRHPERVSRGTTARTGAGGGCGASGGAPRVLVILDGASEPLGVGPTSLERAATPVLDALVAEGSLSRLRTVAPGLPAGSESAIPALLGWTPPAPVDRGAVEAAAHELPLGPGEHARRVDVRSPDSGRASAADARVVAAVLAATLPDHAVHVLGGHRLLVVGRAPLPALVGEGGRRVWPAGRVPPRVLDAATTVVAARGAAAGIGRLMGARVVVPPGATGRPGSDLAAKAAAALAALEAGGACVVVHVGAPDEAAHELDAPAKVAAIEQADRVLLAPLVHFVRERGGSLRICPDHGCDPRTGLHDAAAVPCVTWPASGPRLAPAGARLTERAVAALPLVALPSAAGRERVAA
jgi:2,3-bisphosphoglycerate-independent phosphoglycerate mutase